MYDYLSDTSKLRVTSVGGAMFFVVFFSFQFQIWIISQKPICHHPGLIVTWSRNWFWLIYYVRWYRFRCSILSPLFLYFFLLYHSISCKRVHWVVAKKNIWIRNTRLINNYSDIECLFGENGNFYHKLHSEIFTTEWDFWLINWFFLT